MAKKSYVAEDELGHVWLVRAGDPAFPHLTLIPATIVPTVLPLHTFRTGQLTSRDWVLKRLAALGGAAALLSDDPDVMAELVRYNNLNACLWAAFIFAAVPITEEEETTVG